MLRIYFIVIIICASSFCGVAQTYLWESPPNGADGECPFVKIKENLNGDFFIIGGNDPTKVGCFKLNKFGELIWKNPQTFSTGLTDFISYDNDHSYYVVGGGHTLPQRSLLFNINDNGIINFERDILTKNYVNTGFNKELYNNKIASFGYKYNISTARTQPILEFRSLNGDTLGKFIINSTQNCYPEKMFSLPENNGFLFFCTYTGSGYPFITTLIIDSLGNKLKENFYIFKDYFFYY